MKVKYYPIRGRGEAGDKFQLARVLDERGEMYKGQYDQARHFSSEEELKTYLAEVVKVAAEDLQLSKLDL